MIYVRRDGEPSKLRKKDEKVTKAETKKKVGRPKKGATNNG